MADETTGRMRLDKWLWAVRLYKTRSVATEACRAGHVKVNDASAKPAHELQAGQEVLARTPGGWRRGRVVACPKSRVGAALVNQYLEELELPEHLKEEDRSRAVLAPPPKRSRGSGRPTKKDRRLLDSFFGE